MKKTCRNCGTEQSGPARTLRALSGPSPRGPQVVRPRPIARAPARPALGCSQRVHRPQAAFATVMTTRAVRPSCRREHGVPVSATAVQGSTLAECLSDREPLLIEVRT